MKSPFDVVVGSWSLYGGLFINFVMCVFYFTIVMGSGNVGSLNLELATPV